MSIRIVSPGPFTTVQDAGRFGYMASGIGPSGVMNRTAWEYGNALVGNIGGEASLEMMLGGITAEFTEDTVIALTGADFGAQLTLPDMMEGIPLAVDTAYVIPAGSTLKMGFARTECRAYLSVRGGIDVPVVMDSRSTAVKYHLGGFEGRKLAAGDVLSVGAYKTPDSMYAQKPTEAAGGVACTGFRKLPRSAEARQIPHPRHLPRPIPGRTRVLTVRVVPGPQDDYFSAESARLFYTQEYSVTAESDRMGIRLDGEPLSGTPEHPGTDIVSDGVTFGSIQITRKGLPIVLMADHQTTGGYAKIGTVATADLWKLAEALPGDAVRFMTVTPAEAEEALRHPERRTEGPALTGHTPHAKNDNKRAHRSSGWTCFDTDRNGWSRV